MSINNLQNNSYKLNSNLKLVTVSLNWQYQWIKNIQSITGKYALEPIKKIQTAKQKRFGLNLSLHILKQGDGSWIPHTCNSVTNIFIHCMELSIEK